MQQNSLLGKRFDFYFYRFCNVYLVCVFQVEMLEPNDSISLIVFESTASVLHSSTLIKYQQQTEKMLEVLEELEPRGGTAIKTGLQCAFDAAKKCKEEFGDKNRCRRVALFTDMCGTEVVE